MSCTNKLVTQPGMIQTWENTGYAIEPAGDPVEVAKCLFLIYRVEMSR